MDIKKKEASIGPLFLIEKIQSIARISEDGEQEKQIRNTNDSVLIKIANACGIIVARTVIVDCRRIIVGG